MTSDIGKTGADAELIVEAVVENLALKQKLFADLEAASSDRYLSIKRKQFTNIVWRLDYPSP